MPKDTVPAADTGLPNDIKAPDPAMEPDGHNPFEDLEDLIHDVHNAFQVMHRFVGDALDESIARKEVMSSDDYNGCSYAMFHVQDQINALKEKYFLIYNTVVKASNAELVASWLPKRNWPAPRHPDAVLFRLEQEFKSRLSEQRAMEEEDDGVDYLDDPKYRVASATTAAIIQKIITHETATLEGLRSKASVISLYTGTDPVNLREDITDPQLDVASSLVRDLLVMKGDA